MITTINQLAPCNSGASKKVQNEKHGNQKYARKVDSSLSLRVNSADKASWQRSAALHGMSLNEWVIQKLNDKEGSKMSGLVFYDSEGNIAAQHIDGNGWYFDTERITHKSQALDVINMLMDRFGVTVGEI